ncbi:hypothetical protein CPB84DRAFT_1799691 [Gymnopilus junonius]|uniref:Uncharacterized protein n=1 Tax=Gymnopilus junonius TaxID=109634 RepID=A0A9P5NA46_GYMJU|nr:hypothetical protein CPB84DRAFT_1799691 [Gymnopilus junonius]
MSERNVSVEPNVPCDRCRGVIGIIQARFLEFRQSDQTKSSAPFRIDYGQAREVQASGLKGCHFCSIISQKLCPTHSERDISQPPGSFITITMSFNNKGSKVVASADAWLKDANRNRLVNGTIFIDSNIDSNQPVAASWSMSTGSDAALDLASTWLHQCTSNHQLSST